MNGEIIVGIITAAVAIFGGAWIVLEKVYKLGGRLERLDILSTKISEVEVNTSKINDRLSDDLKKLPCEKHSDRMAAAEANTATISGMIQIFMQTLQGKNPIIEANSPIQLTPYGQKLASKLNLDGYINERWEDISEKIEKCAGFGNPYDIQQCCFDYVFKNPEAVLSEEGYNNAKLMAFSTGDPVLGILQAAAIIVRDKYFAEHNIEIDDIDIYDNAKSAKIEPKVEDACEEPPMV